MPDKVKNQSSTDDKRGPDKGEAYGMGAVTQALKGSGFPAKKDELVKRAGTHSISWTKGGEKMKLADLINQAPSDDFPSMSNVISAVAAAARKSGAPSTGGGKR